MFLGGGEIGLGSNDHGFKKSACILCDSYSFKMPMGILKSLYFLCVQDAHGLLVNFESLSIDAILFNSAFSIWIKL